MILQVGLAAFEESALTYSVSEIDQEDKDHYSYRNDNTLLAVEKILQAAMTRPILDSVSRRSFLFQFNKPQQLCD